MRSLWLSPSACATCSPKRCFNRRFTFKFGESSISARRRRVGRSGGQDEERFARGSVKRETNRFTRCCGDEGADAVVKASIGGEDGSRGMSFFNATKNRHVERRMARSASQTLRPVAIMNIIW